MGAKSSEVLGKTDFDLFSDPRRAHEIRTEDYSTINHGRIHKSVVEYEKPNGEIRIVNIIRLLITNPDPGASLYYWLCFGILRNSGKMNWI